MNITKLKSFRLVKEKLWVVSRKTARIHRAYLAHANAPNPLVRSMPSQKSVERLSGFFDGLYENKASRWIAGK